jgi:ABC-2 type transport system permease protein
VTGTVYRIVLRTQMSLGRLAFLVLLAGVGLVVSLAIGFGDVFDRLDAGTNLINAFGLSLYAPVATLVLASAALSDPIDDGTMVYLWLRPIARWKIGLGALLATWTVTLPLVLGPLVAMAALSGGGASLVRGTLVAGSLAVIAYGALFVLLGLWVRRALIWGLAYILLWEGFVAIAGDNAQRLAIRSYTRSILSDTTGVNLFLADIAVTASVIVPLAVAVAAFALTAWRLRKMEVA